jgi:hypothetical protein
VETKDGGVPTSGDKWRRRYKSTGRNACATGKDAGLKPGATQKRKGGRDRAKRGRSMLRPYNRKVWVFAAKIGGMQERPKPLGKGAFIWETKSQDEN